MWKNGLNSICCCSLFFFGKLIHFIHHSTSPFKYQDVIVTFDLSLHPIWIAVLGVKSSKEFGSGANPELHTFPPGRPAGTRQGREREREREKLKGRIKEEEEEGKKRKGGQEWCQGDYGLLSPSPIITRAMLGCLPYLHNAILTLLLPPSITSGVSPAPGFMPPSPLWLRPVFICPSTKDWFPAVSQPYVRQIGISHRMMKHPVS